MARVRLPAVLADWAGQRELEVDAATVLDAIKALDTLRLGLADRICTELNEPRKHVLIYVDDTEVRLLDGMQTRLNGGETIYVVPSVTGG
ncbi:MAG: MoaD/ThiS family protein [Planctomycetota bacterium]